MSKQFDKQFKESAVEYYFSHKEPGLKKCAENLGISRRICYRKRHTRTISPIEYEKRLMLAQLKSIMQLLRIRTAKKQLLPSS